ncbi:MAG: hypothetical protein RR133_00735 [Kiritimatiellia bacterium]
MSQKHIYAPRIAKTVHGGLRLQSSRKNVWWRQQWITYLESLRMGARLGRGRNYAQLGQIKTLTLIPGKLTAEVQGASEAPYQIVITMPELNAALMSNFLKTHPTITAQLYTHGLPISIETELQRQGLSLFPRKKSDMHFECTCKDWSRPCKHLAATLYLFIDAISADPLLFLRFRGIELSNPMPPIKPEILDENTILHLAPATINGLLSKRLGTLPYWRGTEDFLKTLESCYLRSKDRALKTLDSLSSEFRFPQDRA